MILAIGQSKPIRAISIAITLGILLFLLVGSPMVWAVDSLETSVIFLVIRTGETVVESDYFFEVLDMGEYILLPLSPLIDKLGLKVELKREQGVLLIQGREGAQVEVDVNHNFYLCHPTWADEPPIQLDGEVYVSSRLVAYLTGARIEWIAKIQELVIDGDWKYSIESVQGSEHAVQTEKQVKAEETVKNLVMGDAISLGSVQYRLVTEYRTEESGTGRLATNAYATLHGRVQDWAISLGERTRIDLLTGKMQVALPLIRAQYTGGNRWIVLGDTVVNLNHTLGQKGIRGVYYQSPERHTGKLLALTTVAVDAEVGDRVELYVNGALFSKQVVTVVGGYTFSHVPLEIQRTNILKAVIWKSNGQRVEWVKQVAGSPRILEPGTEEYLFALGLYKGSNSAFAGMMAGVDMHLALNENFTLDWQLGANRPFYMGGQNRNRLGSILGMAARSDAPVVMTLDWLVGGEDEECQQGGKTSLLYTLQSGFLEGTYSYIPLVTTAAIREPAGERLRLQAEWEHQKIRLNFQGERFHSIAEMSPEKKNLAQLTAQFSADQQKVTSITGKVSDREYLIMGENGAPMEVTVNEGGLILDHRSESTGMSKKGKLSLQLADSSLHRESEVQMEMEGSIYRKMQSVLMGAHLEAVGTTSDSGLTGEAVVEGRLKWSGSQNLFLSGMGKIVGVHEVEETDPYCAITETELRVLVQKYLNRNTTVYLEGGIHNLPMLSQPYSTASLGISHHMEKGDHELVLSLGYASPLGERNSPQWTGKILWTTYVNPEIQVSLQAQRLYSSLYDETPESIFTFSIGHVLGFAGKQILGQRYHEENQHEAYIGGVVYLDENGNGSQDEGEPKLSQIEMMMEGRRAITDEKGVFRFDNVRPGIYEVGFELRSLLADYSVVTENQLVQIRENENMFLTFGLTMNGSIAGRIYEDKNANGVQDAGELPLAWVGVEIGETGQMVYTRKDGTFYLEHLPLGSHTLQVQIETLPAGMQVMNEKQKIRISKDTLDVRGIEIPVVYNF